MSVVQMEKAVEGASLSPKDRKWFVHWVSAYARFRGVGHGGSLPVDEARVIAFLKAQKRRGRVAWQRLQAVRAIEFYCRHVPQQPADQLRDIHVKLQKRAQTEAGGDNDRPPIVEEDLVGRIDPNEPEILQAMRRQMRLGHYSRRTQRAYVGWVSRFLGQHRAWQREAVAKLGEGDVKEFLTDLAVVGNVSSSTRNQALSALLFLFQKVLGRAWQFAVRWIDSDRITEPATARLPVEEARPFEKAGLLGSARDAIFLERAIPEAGMQSRLTGLDFLDRYRRGHAWSDFPSLDHASCWR